MSESWNVANPEFERFLRAGDWSGLVRAAREHRRIDQYVLAERLASDQSVVARMEGPGSIPTIRTLARVALETKLRLTVSLQERPFGDTAPWTRTVEFDGFTLAHRRDDLDRARALIARGRELLARHDLTE